MGEYAPPPDALHAAGLRIAIVAGRFNDHVTAPLLDGALQTLATLGLDPACVPVHWVPGAFEMPLVAQQLAASGRVDAVICLGAVIRGDTAHFEYVAGPCAAFGVLTTNNDQQALDRAGGGEGNKGAEAAATAVEMVALLRELSGKGERC